MAHALDITWRKRLYQFFILVALATQFCPAHQLSTFDSHLPGTAATRAPKLFR